LANSSIKLDNIEQHIRLRPGRLDDAEEVGTIIFEAFSGISSRHGFPPDFENVDIAINTASLLLSNNEFYSVIAEDTSAGSNKVIGSNFLDERSSMAAGVGPLTVDPKFQNKGLGRLLMNDVLGRARSKNCPAIRLLQASYHNRSLSLYSSLGFEVREPISNMQGRPIQAAIPGKTVRLATESDLEPCKAICNAIHGHDRNGELRDSIKQGMAKVVLSGDKITGYTSGLSFFNHSVGFTNDDIKALIASATGEQYGGPGILIPSRNTNLWKWCFENGLRLTQQLTLMTIGLYNEPAGAFMPSILY
jgi:predicted N-acetyltransferase YhbS